jgi:hypothetical protein
MADNLPYGAADILALRNAGKRPADMVLVSLLGPLPSEGNPVLLAQLGRRYDWRFLTGLECLVVADSTLPQQAVRELMGQLKLLAATYLGLWFADRQQGINFIVGGVTARARGLLRYMDEADRQNFAGIGQRQEYPQCA